MIDCDSSSREKIHLLHLVQSLKIGGAEILMVHILNALGMTDYHHYVYCFGHDGPIRSQIESIGVPVRLGKRRASIKRPLEFTRTLYGLIRDLVQCIKDWDIQVVQSHLGQANQLAVLVSALTGIPAFPTIHSTMAFQDNRSPLDSRVMLNRIINQAVYRKAKRVITVSEEIKRISQRMYHLTDSRILVFRNGILIDEHFMNVRDIESEFPDSVGKIKIIAVGRLIPSKGFDIVIRAVAELVHNGFQNIWMIIVGEGKQSDPLEKLIQELKLKHCVRLTGCRYDVTRLMKGSDMYVLPSRYEGLSIAMIEAMSCALPIIGSDAPGVRDFIVDGENGIRFHTDDVSGLAECIRRLANDQNLRARLSHGARHCFERNYDMRSNVKPLDRLFRQYASC